MTRQNETLDETRAKMRAAAQALLDEIRGITQFIDDEMEKQKASKNGPEKEKLCE